MHPCGRDEDKLRLAQLADPLVCSHRFVQVFRIATSIKTSHAVIRDRNEPRQLFGHSFSCLVHPKPTIPASARRPAIRTGVLRGKTPSSAIGAVPISPITDDLTVDIGLAPSVISTTSIPCKNCSGIFVTLLYVSRIV